MKTFKVGKVTWVSKSIQPTDPTFKTNFIKKLFYKHKYIWLIPMEDHYIEKCLRCGKRIKS